MLCRRCIAVSSDGSPTAPAHSKSITRCAIEFRDGRQRARPLRQFTSVINEEIARSKRTRMLAEWLTSHSCSSRSRVFSTRVARRRRGTPAGRIVMYRMARGRAAAVRFQLAVVGFMHPGESRGHSLFGFRSDPEAKYFYGQAASEAAVIAATDWNAAA